MRRYAASLSIVLTFFNRSPFPRFLFSDTNRILCLFVNGNRSMAFSSFIYLILFDFLCFILLFWSKERGIRLGHFVWLASSFSFVFKEMDRTDIPPVWAGRASRNQNLFYWKYSIIWFLSYSLSLSRCVLTYVKIPHTKNWMSSYPCTTLSHAHTHTHKCVKRNTLYTPVLFQRPTCLYLSLDVLNVIENRRSI